MCVCVIQPKRTYVGIENPLKILGAVGTIAYRLKC